jgi:O-antigen ligase
LSIRLSASLADASGRRALSVERAGVLLLAASIPPLFLHDRYQPSVDIQAGGASVTVRLADVAVLAVAATAAVVAVRTRGAVLRAHPVLWSAVALFAGLIVVSTFYGTLRDAGYAFGANFVTAVKFAEYALLAPATALLVRRRQDVLVVLGALVAWTAASCVVALLQFFGVVAQLRGRAPGERTPALSGVHDFAALSGAAVAVALLALALAALERRERPLAVVAGAAGYVGLVLSAALDALAGTLAATALLAGVGARFRRLSARRALALVALSAMATVGALTLRAADLNEFLRFLRVRPAVAQTSDEVQTYAHRTVLTYIGTRIFLDHPVFGVGWQGSAEEFAYAPYLDDARARFPDQPAQVFPSPAHPWGVQNAYVQALADMGAVGLLTFLFVLGAAFGVCLRPVLRAPPSALAARVALAWLLLAAAGLAALGLYAGAPVDALLWLGVGLAAAAEAAP